jgi:hypothetical protein
MEEELLKAAVAYYLKQAGYSDDYISANWRQFAQIAELDREMTSSASKD